MKVSTTMIVTAGAISGQMISRAMRHSEAPSRRAASMKSVGMRWIAARNTSVGKPNQCQLLTSSIAGSAVSGRPSQGSAQSFSPMPISALLTSPKTGFRNSFH